MHLASPWTPRLGDAPADGGKRPLERLVAALAEDITSGAVPTGARLPPHRELAYQLGIGLGTVTKAYAALERRGLVHAVRGRGMFVAGTTPLPQNRVDLSINTPPQMLSDRLLAATLSKLAKRLDAGSFGAYTTGIGSPRQRAQMAQWLGLQRLEIAAEQVLLCNGAQHALSVAFALVAPSGTRVLTERHSYPGAISLARQGLHPLEGLACDAQGLLPQALEQALTSQRAAEPAPVLYVTPTLQNPTGATMGLDRRLEIARLCRAHDITVIEDDVYSIFAPPDMPPLAMLAPERVVYVSGLSKVLSPGLFMGVIAPPAALVPRAIAIIQATSSMASPVTSLMMEEWLADGTAPAIATSIRQEAVRRNDLVRAILPEARIFSAARGFHLWLAMPLPEASALVRALAGDGVILPAPERFTSDPEDAYSGLRISIGAPPLEALERALHLIRRRLDAAQASEQAGTAGYP